MLFKSYSLCEKQPFRLFQHYYLLPVSIRNFCGSKVLYVNKQYLNSLCIVQLEFLKGLVVLEG